MQLTGTPPTLVFSASDLSSFVGCRHRTALDLGVALGESAKPVSFYSYSQELRDRGAEDEARYVESLVAGAVRVGVPYAEADAAGERAVDNAAKDPLVGDALDGARDVDQLKLRRELVAEQRSAWSTA